ncbi:GIY-YIG nuclease family protein [Dialister pneumosintes]|uniref:GIY-YIG nuclease family protein n=1 Tax=Dialister pneumosintes TaxID=39950 RepID=A0ABX9MAJ8_9FIRM|nr:GIY-YIG nuclease family protein [Dialister pneumosintes]MBS6480464.1 GIY-YIG nuclease family protein [Dialister sp.]RID94621.1 GIY-YIG nuclease family protein [Dialister pneumosintes]
MSNGKNFNLFLMDGDVTGRIKCTLSNWTGLAYKIPRSHLDKCKERQDLKQSGVYFLFGRNDNNEEVVYVGQAGIRKNGEGVLFRVTEHLKDKEYFSDAVILTTQNNSFGPTEISYLENKFTNLARETERFKVRNENEPNAGNVTEEKESELEDFVVYSKMVLGVLGYKIFVPLIKTEKDNNIVENTAETLLYLHSKSKKSNRTIKATCKRTNEGFVVLKGSMIEEIDYFSIPTTLKEKRANCKKRKDIVDGKLYKNMLFDSPSYASMFVLGRSSNGRTDWKTKDGMTLSALEEKEI